jgi:hypothetical protein
MRCHFYEIGCRITTLAFAVDFDYAVEGGCIGIDAWFLLDFSKTNSAIRPKFPLLTSGEQVEQLLQELVQEGLLTRYLYAPPDGRYYVTADILNFFIHEDFFAPHLPLRTLLALLAGTPLLWLGWERGAEWCTFWSSILPARS